MMRFREMRDFLMAEQGWCRKTATLAARYYLNVEEFGETIRWCLPVQIGRGSLSDPLLTPAQWQEIVRRQTSAS